MKKRNQRIAVFLICLSMLLCTGFTSTLFDLSTQVTGILPTTSMPALTGDVTSSSGTVATTIATGAVSRAKEAADGKAWSFLGSATNGSAAITVGPLIWTTTCQEYEFHYIITGYSGGAVGRFLSGAASITNSGATNATAFSEGVTAPSTLTGAAGIPLAVTVSAIAREGWIRVYGASGAIKSINVIGQNGNPSASTAPTLFRATSFFSDLGTNLPLKRVQLSVYLAITGSTISSTTTFNSGTTIEGWCRNGD